MVVFFKSMFGDEMIANAKCRAEMVVEEKEVDNQEHMASSRNIEHMLCIMAMHTEKLNKFD